MKVELWSMYKLKERIWKQKLRVKWFQESDRNIKFFHVVASARKKANYIHKLAI